MFCLRIHFAANIILARLIQPEVFVRKLALTIFSILLITLFLTACSSNNNNSSAPAKAVEEYLNALVAKDENRLPTLVCSDWEDQALIELDSFQAVTPRLEGAACEQSGSDGDTALVKCSGKIIATYNNEDQELDLSTRTYQVVQQGGNWLVCGTR
jgi:hypothetical protein